MDELDLKSYGKNDADFAERMRAAGIAVSEFHAAADRIRNTLNIAEFHQVSMRLLEHFAQLAACSDRVMSVRCHHAI